MEYYRKPSYFLLEKVQEGFPEEVSLKQGSTGWVEFGFGYAEDVDRHSRWREL